MNPQERDHFFLDTFTPIALDVGAARICTPQKRHSERRLALELARKSLNPSHYSLFLINSNLTTFAGMRL